MPDDCYEPQDPFEESSQEPIVTDAINEDEDMSDPLEAVVVGEGEDEGEENNLPNNDFCFTEADFIETRNNFNDATRHRGVYNESWAKIKALEGEEVIKTHGTDGAIRWIVVPSESIEDDVFREVRKRELEFINTKKIMPIKNEEVFEGKENRTEAFWKLWPGDLDEDVATLNKIIEEDNKKRKEKYQRVIRRVSKAEFIIFHSLLIGASNYTQQGEKLWRDQTRSNRKRRKGLLLEVDFGNYMKDWRFKQIKYYISHIMEDIDLKTNEDDWWRFKKRVQNFNNNRKENIYASHIRVLDESMSAFVPRQGNYWLIAM